MNYKGCIQCGFIALSSNVLGNFCPDCSEALIMSFDTQIFGSEGALEEQKKYCDNNGIVRDWSDPLHTRKPL